MGFSQLLAGLVFGGVGFVAFVYGKKQAQLKTMVLGITLMAYPYFITNGLALWLIGAGLTAALFLVRGE